MVFSPALFGSVIVLCNPVMQHAAGAPKGLVLAAPHEGYDMYSGDLAKRVSKKLGWGWVVAKEYRDTKAKRWLDVNRPTERRWSGSRKGDEKVTDKGKTVFAEYVRRLRSAAQVGQSESIPLLVEFHGHNRRVKIGTQKLRLDVIEVATQGFNETQLRELQARFDALADQRWPVGDRIQLRIDRLHERYRYRGTMIRFNYRASGAKREGSLQPSVSAHALHFELPQNARSTKTQRSAFAEILAKTIAPLAAELALPARTATGAAGRIGDPTSSR
jgi:hypothetical protein